MPAAEGEVGDPVHEPGRRTAPGLATDLYELTMAASYLRRGMRGPATFNLFVRRLPPERGYLVAAGLEDSLRFLEAFSLDHGELEWLSRHGFTDDEVARLGTLRFSGDVAAIPSERDAFTAFAQDRPGPVTFLVDTYDTMRGVDAAADTIQTGRRGRSRHATGRQRRRAEPRPPTSWWSTPDDRSASCRRARSRCRAPSKSGDAPASGTSSHWPTRPGRRAVSPCSSP